MASKDDSDEQIVKDAHAEFAVCEDRESMTRLRWKADLRFANGDPDNGYQWEDAMRAQREVDKRPCLTINKVKQHNRQITNDARQNKPSVRVYPVDDGADKKTAEIFNGIIRHIEANSNADTAYDIAGEFAVDAGLGYWRITTDYAADDTFDQEIYIVEVPNPLNVYLYGYTKVDGSDATRGFVFEDIPKKQFQEKYPNCQPSSWPTSAESTAWFGEEMIRVAEYFKIIEESDTLCADDQGNTFRLSEVADAKLAKQIKANDQIKKRPIKTKKCKWFKIAGNEIIDRSDWLGKYIPIVRVIGDEVEIDGKVDRKGHTRNMKDAQRMYNFWTTAAVEFVALQGKQPYLAAAEAIAGYEEYWNGLNSANHPYLPYNSLDENGTQIPAPQRQQPPVMAPAYITGMQIATQEMKEASGQYDASLGQKSNETSGRAIMARQREGDTATFHFIDNVSRAIRFTGKILVDLIPKVYDTARVVRILGEDGKEDKAHLDPSQPQAVSEMVDPLTSEIKQIYNPSVGRYDVIVQTGPSYGTRRQEAFQALTDISNRNPQLMNVAGDLIMKAADFPMADQIAERLEKTLPPNLQDEDDGQKIPPAAQAQIQQLTQHVQQMDGAIQNMSQELEDKDIERKKLAIQWYDSQTKRLQAESAAAASLAGPNVVAEIGEVKAMMIDIMHGIKNPSHLEALPPHPAQTPPSEAAPQQQAPSGAFFTPEQNQQ